LMEHLEASASIKHDVRELDTLNANKIIELLDTLGEDMGSKQFKQMLESVDRAANEVGNVVANRSDMVETLLEMLEKQEIDFGPDGKPCDVQAIVCTEGMWDKINEAEKIIMENPHL